MFNLLIQFLKRNLPKKIIPYLGQIKFFPFKLWAWLNSSNLENFCVNLNFELWKESKNFSYIVENKRKHFLKKKYSGAGAYIFLYFVTRLIKPSTIIETGVAAGWSSLAFLAAIDLNKKGFLYSSDLPNNSFENDNTKIGVVVPKNLRKSWSLCIKGDNFCIPEFLKDIKTIDIFHYDSDKSVKSRSKIFSMISNKLSDSSVIIFDDIHINGHFRKLVKNSNFYWKVFKFENKYFGIIFSNKILNPIA